MRELTRLVVEQLLQLRPDVTAEAVGPGLLKLRARPPVELTVSLQDLTRACLADVEHTTGHIVKFAGHVVEQLMLLETPAPLRREGLLPLLRTPEQVQALQDASPPPGIVLSHAGPAGLRVAYGVTLGTQTQIVTRALQEELGLEDDAALHACALDNLARAYPPLVRLPLEAAPRLDSLVTPVPASSLVLLDALWEPPAWLHPLAVAVPARDVLLLVEAPSETALAELGAVAATIYRKAPLPLLPMPLVRTQGRWSALPGA